MAKVTPTLAPDFTEDERAWIDKHPIWRVVFMAVRLALMPALLTIITTYFQFRSTSAEKKTDETYKAVAPVVNSTQEELKALQKQVDLLQQLVTVVARNGTQPAPAPTVAAPAAPTAARPVAPALAPKPALPIPVVKAKLIEQLETAQHSNRAVTYKALPESATEAVQQMKK